MTAAEMSPRPADLSALLFMYQRCSATAGCRAPPKEERMLSARRGRGVRYGTLGIAS